VSNTTARKPLHELEESRGSFSIKDPTYCPACGTGASGSSEIVKKFGLRTMEDGVTRVQSWCKGCRGYRFSTRLN